MPSLEALFAKPDWYRAVTLEERVRALRGNGPQPSASFDARLASEELGLWRSQQPFASDEWFERRLALHGISSDELLRVLGEPVEALREQFGEPPGWLAECEAAYAHPLSPSPDSSTAAIESASGGDPSSAFLLVFEPLVRRGYRRLECGLERIVAEHPELPFAASALGALFTPHLEARLGTLATRVMVLELNVARLQGRLRGNSAEERFRSFAQDLSQTGPTLLMEYAVLCRRAVESIAAWVETSLEICTRLAHDMPAIEQRFFAAPGPPTRIESGAGDTHRGGRSVSIVHFGSRRRLVYKPRSLAVEVHFGELCTWLNERGDHPPLRRIEVLDCGSHGWVEFVSPEACRSVEEVHRFYLRQGALLAVLYALEATDFHYENLIAAGEHPLPVDLESLFHGRIDPAHSARADERLAEDMALNSVLRIGLLPQRAGSGAEPDAIDLSGIGAQGGQLTPDRLLAWEGSGTDEMRATRRRVEIPGGHNQPRLELEAAALGAALASEEAYGRVDPIEHIPELRAGFRQMYGLLERSRESLLAADGPLQRFAGDEIRCVLRPTRAYGLLLLEALHPDFLRDALERGRFLDRLWVGVDEAPHLTPVLAAERADLVRGDVPLFTTRPDSRDLWTSEGERLPVYWERSGLDEVRARLQGFCAQDLERQLWLIESSMSSLTLANENAPWPSYEPFPRRAAPAQSELAERAVEAALGIAERLAELSLSNAEDVAWAGLSLDGERSEFAPLQADLYSGTSGVIHFLAQLGAVTGDEASTQLARRALTTLERCLDPEPDSERALGAFDGIGGVIYVMTHCASLWREPQRLRSLLDVELERLPAWIDADEALDLVDGCAGLIPILLGARRVIPDERLLELALRCGEHLLQRASPRESGLAWATKLQGERPLPGFSHGPSGINWALIELFAATGEVRYRETALSGLAYEQTRFVLEEGNWVARSDDRQPAAVHAAESVLSMAWCYGAPGVGLSRLRALEVLGEELSIRTDIEAAVATTLAHGFGRNHCLCHGDLGNLDFLWQAARTIGSQPWDEARRRALDVTLRSLERDGPLCGIPAGMQSLGLMNGLAGIGFGLLRQARPERVPSVLSLDPPACLPAGS